MQRLSVAGVTLAVLALGAVFGGAQVTAEEEDDAVVEVEEIEDLLGAFEALSADLATPTKALESLAASQSGTPVAIELGAVRKDGRLTAAWEVLLVQEGGVFEWSVDARTGAVLGSEKEADAAIGAAWLRHAKGAERTLDDVAALMAGSFEGAVTVIELDVEEAGVGWEVGLVHGGRLHEFFVNSAGKVAVDVEDDDDDDEDEDDEDGEDDDDDEDEDD